MAKNGKKGGSKPSDGANVISVPLIWTGVDDVPVRAVDQTYSQFSPEGMFVVTFGIANPPPLMGGRKNNRELLESLQGIRVNPVARLAMTEAHAEKVVKALQQNLRQYRSTQRAKE